MGNCLSTPDVNEGHRKGVQASAGQYKSGKAAHDSVHSLDTAGSRDAAPHGTWGSKQEQHSNSNSSSSPSKGQKQQQHVLGSPQASSNHLSAAGELYLLLSRLAAAVLYLFPHF